MAEEDSEQSPWNGLRRAYGERDSPPSLIGVSASVSTDDLFEQLPVADESLADKRARMIFNHKVKTAKRDKRAREDAYEAGLKKLKNGHSGLLGPILGLM